MTKIKEKQPLSQHANRLADDVDIYAGEQLRKKRKELGLTQQELAQILKISFQQLQKYEKGVNRIGIGRLFSICQALKTTPSYFFKNYIALEHDETLVAEPKPLPLEGNEAQLLDMFRNIENEKLRKQVINLVKTLSVKNQTP